jgi:signal transduction histidine kinase
MRDRHVSWRRLLGFGILAAVLAAVTGLALEWIRFGWTEAQAMTRVDAEVRREFSAMTSLLAERGSAIAGDRGTSEALLAARSQQAEPDAARALFDVIDRQLGDAKTRTEMAVTIYDFPDGVARAWAGRPSDIPNERIRTPRSWFVTPSPQGLRLVHIIPVSAGDDAPVGVVATEHALSPAPAAGTIAQTEYLLPTAFGPASLRLGYEGAGEQVRPDVVLLKSPDGDVLVEATISPAQIARVRSEWRRRVAASVLAILAISLVLLIGPVLDHRSMSASVSQYRRFTAVATVLIGAAAVTAWVTLDAAFDGGPGSHALLLVSSAAVAAVMALLAAPISKLPSVARARRRTPSSAPVRFTLVHLLAGGIVMAFLVGFEVVLKRALEVGPVDLRHFSLHPWSVERLVLLGGILTAQLATLWAATLLLAAAVTFWRITRSAPRLLGLWLLWVAPAFVISAIAVAREWPVPALGVSLAAAACAAAAIFAPRAARWFRHAAVAARILALFVAFVVPSLLLYPSVNFFTVRAVRDVVATQYAVEAQNHPQMLQQRLEEVKHEIDVMPGLGDLVQGGAAAKSEGRATESAFLVWRQTALARARLTSAIELYDASGNLVSRFALNHPEYTGTIQTPRGSSSCHWAVFGEAAPFGSEERRMLHAEKSICEGTGDSVRILGSIVVHLVPDYRTLPFITSQSPYFEVFRTQGGAPAEGTTGSDVDIVIYGWGLTPLYASGAAAWPITDELFARIYHSREPFWTEMERGDVRWHVFFSNDRNGIYALGFPALTLFDRFVHLAELTTLAGVAFVIVLLATAAFTRVARERPRVGRALLREIRASFYRKLFLAFVLASIIPVLTLAFVIRTYFAGLLRADVEAEAARSAAVAQRVIEESQAGLRRGGEPLPPASDDVLIWISQVIDQDVNIFQGPNLLATSERDLFASGLLPTRTPADVYRSVALQRLPSFVGEDRIATLPYMIAAAPVRVGGREAILTVPLANQQREIEQEVDEIDRGVHLAALFFILLGAAMGLSMAERIADPVRRLTRATRRIASGDFDARIAVKSADELRRLVDAFNSMAAELKAQRGQLERTHRLEAWAEMARQVAHEIKNPLTPIQLSAEHLRRVHADRGEPMGAVLESCVSSILGQVRLLRQISSEFSNFASSPIARPAPTDIPELVAEVVDPYRTGLAGRVEIHNDVAPPLPRAFIDRTLIGRALSNIVENALHAMPGKGSLTLTATEERDSVALRIRDTGVGMDEESLARVFEPYFSTKATGTGLGLPIARRNVELSGGRIEVESARRQGTTVILHLPTSAPAADVAVTAPDVSVQARRVVDGSAQ